MSPGATAPDGCRWSFVTLPDVKYPGTEARALGDARGRDKGAFYRMLFSKTNRRRTPLKDRYSERAAQLPQLSRHATVVNARFSINIAETMPCRIHSTLLFESLSVVELAPFGVRPRRQSYLRARHVCQRSGMPTRAWRKACRRSFCNSTGCPCAHPLPSPSRWSDMPGRLNIENFDISNAVGRLP